jgi:beta-lactamase regulating signal transducer with metallopeptidase domain
MSLFTQSALLKALGWSLLNSIWQMGLLWLLYLLITALVNIFYKKSAAGFRHSFAIFILGAGSAWSGISFFRLLAMGGEGSSDSPVLLPVSVAIVFIGQAMPLLSCLYLVVVAMLLIRTIHQYRQAGTLRQHGLHKAQPELRLFVDQIRRSLGIQKKVVLWLSSMAEAPLTIGFLKPVILLPVAMINNLDMQQVEAVLLHELAHIKKNDYLLNLLIRIVETLFFFNPFTKWLIHRIRREREHRCDDLVMQFRYDPHSYASALLQLARSQPDHPQLAMAATGWDDRLLLQRVRRIMELKSDGDRSPGDRSMKKPALFFLYAALAVFPSLFHSQVSGVHGTARRSATGSLPSPPVHANAANIPTVAHKTAATTTTIVATVYSHPAKPFPRYGVRGVNFPVPVTAVAVPAVKPEIRDFSIALPADPAAPWAGNFPGQPFVPSSSFTYLLTAGDQSVHTLFSGQVEQALKMLAATDWNQIEKKLLESGSLNRVCP